MDDIKQAAEELYAEHPMAMLIHDARVRESIIDLMTQHAEHTVNYHIEELSNRDPYPVDMCHVDNKKYVELVPNTTERTGISWHLMGCGWRNAVAEYQRMIKE